MWEFITSGEAVDIVQKSLSAGADCDAACQVLIETAAKLWQREEGDYRDDVSTFFLFFLLLSFRFIFPIFSYHLIQFFLFVTFPPRLRPLL